MKTHDRIGLATLVPIGNSKGIRLPKVLLLKYHFVDEILLEEKPEGILIRSRTNRKNKKLSWEETFRVMAREKEDWGDFEGTSADGLEKE